MFVGEDNVLVSLYLNSFFSYCFCLPDCYRYTFNRHFLIKLCNLHVNYRVDGADFSFLVSFLSLLPVEFCVIQSFQKIKLHIKTTLSYHYLT